MVSWLANSASQSGIVLSKCPWLAGVGAGVGARELRSCRAFLNVLAWLGLRRPREGGSQYSGIGKEKGREPPPWERPARAPMGR